MNREIIKKYKEAFDWWLEGGKVWLRYKDDKEWKLTDMPYFNEGFIYIPDDGYAELRKAWYDGGKLQYYHPVFENWRDYNKQEIPDFKTSLFDWRIKPDEWYEELDGTIENGVICWVWDDDKKNKVIHMVIEYKESAYPFITIDCAMRELIVNAWRYAEPIKCSDLKEFQKDE